MQSGNYRAYFLLLQIVGLLTAGSLKASEKANHEDQESPSFVLQGGLLPALEPWQGKPFEVIATAISNPMLVAQMESFLQALTPYQPLPYAANKAARDLLVAFLFCQHPHEGRLAREEALRRRFHGQAQEVLNTLAVVAESQGRGALVAADVKAFYTALREFRQALHRLLPQDRQATLQEMINQYTRIEKIYLTSQDRDELVHQDFIAGYRQQLSNLQRKIKDMGGQQALGLLQKARKDLYSEREQEILYHTAEGELYHKKAVDPNFRYTFQEESEHTRTVRSKAKAAMAKQPRDSRGLLSLLVQVREKLKGVKPLAETVSREIDDELSDAKLAAISADLSCPETREVLTFLGAKLRDWGRAQVSQRWASMIATQGSEALADLLALLNDELDYLRSEFINFVLDTTPPDTIMEREQERFAESVKKRRIGLTNTHKLVTHFVRGDDGTHGSLYSQHAPDLMLINLVQDLAMLAEVPTTDEFMAETLASERQVLVAFVKDVNTLVQSFGGLYLFANLARSYGVVLDEAEAASFALRGLGQDGLSTAEWQQGAATHMVEILMGKKPELDSGIIRVAAVQAMAIATCPSSPLSLFLRKKIAQAVRQFLQHGAVACHRGESYIDTLLAKQVEIVAQKILASLRYNLKVHGWRYHKMIAIAALSKQFKLLFALSGDDFAQDPLFNADEKEKLAALKNHLTHLTRVMNGLTIIKQGVAFGGGILPEDSATLSQEELRAHGQQVGLFAYPSHEAQVQEGLVGLLDALIAAKGLPLKNASNEIGIDREGIVHLLTHAGVDHPGYRHFYNFLCDGLKAACRYERKAALSHTVADLFAADMAFIYKSANNILHDFYKRQERENPAKGLFSPLILRSGRASAGFSELNP